MRPGFRRQNRFDWYSEPDNLYANALYYDIFLKIHEFNLDLTYNLLWKWEDTRRSENRSNVSGEGHNCQILDFITRNLLQQHKKKFLFKLECCVLKANALIVFKELFKAILIAKIGWCMARTETSLTLQ